MSFTPKKIRRSDRQLDRAEAMDILTNAEYGTLCTSGENSEPYGTPLNHVVIDGDIYFHCANAGHKIENLKVNSNVCFVAVTKAQAVYANDFTTHYESAIVHGQAAEVCDHKDKESILHKLCLRHLPEHMDKFEMTEQLLARTAVWKINIEQITGKANR